MQIDRDIYRMVEMIIRKYPKYKRIYAEYLEEIMSASTSDKEVKPGRESSKPSSVVEAKALKMNSAYADTLYKRIQAVEYCYEHLTEKEQQVIKMRYWSDRDKIIPYNKTGSSFSERKQKMIVQKVIYQVGKSIGELR